MSAYGLEDALFISFMKQLHTSLTTGFILAISLFPILCLCTWILTSLKARPSPPGTQHEPPVAPYWLPWFGHLFPFLSDPGKTLHSNRKRYPDTPFTLIMMNTKFHVFSSSSTASYIFGKSREFVFEPVVASMMENGVNLPMSDRPKFQTSLGTSGALSKEDQESRAFTVSNHTIWLKYLTGDPLDEIILIYLDKFYLALEQVLNLETREWISVDLHELMRRLIFEASVVTFFGTRLRKYWPNMWQDWKRFNDATYAGVRSNFSFYMQPGAASARERMLQAFEKWVDVEVESWSTNDVWSEKWGVKMNWEREKLGRDHGFSLRGRSCLQASFLFVIVTNAAPMATWFMKSILDSNQHLERFRNEVTPLLKSSNDRPATDLRIDSSTLKKNQFIQGLWKESLRLGSASAAARVVARDARIEGYLVRQGSVILIPVQLMHFNPDIFPNPKEFNPSRWSFDASDQHQVDRQRRQNANLRSFGGGTGLCSGRFVAEQEIISVTATMLLLFDIELEDPESFKLNPRSIGVMSPAKPVRARLRRRDN